MAANTKCFNRKIKYLRVSITDRGNLGLFYRSPGEGWPRGEQREILSREKMPKPIQAAADRGLRGSFNNPFGRLGPGLRLGPEKRLRLRLLSQPKVEVKAPLRWGRRRKLKNLLGKARG